jgi:nucleotide-binding universal stress UspA family protein
MQSLAAITVALDGSALAERALPRAASLAQMSGARLALVRVVKPWPVPGPVPPGIAAADLVPEADVQDADRYLAAQADALRALGPGVDVWTTVRIGDPADELLAVAAEQGGREGNAVLVLTTHGRSGLARTFWGSVADRVLRHAAVPVLLLPASGAAEWPAPAPEGRRLLVTLDGSALAEEILGAVGALAALDASLLLVRVVLPAAPEYMVARAVAGSVEPEESLDAAERYLETVADGLRARGLRVETRALLGPPVPTIVHLATTAGADAIAIATHGRGGAARLVFGSVATGVLQRTTVPLLVLRPTAVRTHPAPADGAPVAAA